MAKKTRTKKRRDSEPTAWVIGGGLAGMTAAKEMAERGLRVVILEASDRLGGKAGAKKIWGRWEDHGFHCFPAWYLNTRALIDDIGCKKNLRDVHQFHFLRKGEFPRLVTTKEFTSVGNLLHNVFNGTLPLEDNLLSYFSVLDLACESFDQRAYLDRVSAVGFLRSRFYTNDAIANFHHQTVLQAAAIPAYDCSAMTLRNVFRAWLRYPSPLYSVLNGNLNDKFIEPFQNHLRSKGVEIRLKTPVEGFIFSGDHVFGIGAGEDGVDVGEKDSVILAVPRDKHSELLFSWQDESARVDNVPIFAEALALQSVPMTALHIHLKRRIEGLPAEHLNLVDSRFGITLVDISQHWEGLEHTTINLVASRSWTLFGLPELDAKALLVNELIDYIPTITWEDFDYKRGVILQTHEAEPLFINTVGAWQHRPQAETPVVNFFVAGDYCQTQADLATMESAVMSGISAASAALKFAGKRVRLAPQRLEPPPVGMLRAVKYAALPIIAPIGLWSQFRRRSQGRRKPAQP